MKISEPISLTGSEGGIPPKPPFRPPRLEAKAKKDDFKFFKSVSHALLDFAKLDIKFFNLFIYFIPV
ncbi:MAG: hypothetical protein ABIJ85_00565 [bacterium]